MGTQLSRNRFGSPIAGVKTGESRETEGQFDESMAPVENANEIRAFIVPIFESQTGVTSERGGIR
jgi:hypothetical protein